MKDEILEKIIENYLDHLEKYDYQKLANELEISLPQLKYYLDIIKSLDPTPGTKFIQKTSDYAVPDIIVEKDENGFKVHLNREGMPQLRINSHYKMLLNQKAQSNPDLKKYLEEKFKSALWFLRSLDQRNQTIYKVAKYVVEKQRDFLEKGLKWLKPLTLAEVAEAINVHESTVSRVVSNKFILTPQGLLPLKFFFPKRFTDKAGRELPNELIKEKISSLIKNEDPNNPLSDAEIVDILADNGIKLSRRTVAKYRSQLKIPSSHIRKRIILTEEFK
jgi:RNA polymerase sigma-54 factor